MLDKNNIKHIYPLSPLQEGILFHYIQNNKSEAYFEQTAYHIEGVIDYKLFDRAFKLLIEKYDVLRTAFVFKKVDAPKQVVLKERSSSAFVMDISDLNQQEKDQYIEYFSQKDRNNKFDLTKDPLVRFSILKLSDKSNVIIWSFHHIILDGWSVGMLLKDLMGMYNSLIEDTKCDIMVDSSYSFYVEWLKKQDREAGVKYWKEYLKGVDQQSTIYGLNTKSEEYNLKESTIVLSEQINNSFYDLSSNYKVTLNSIFQTIWGIFIQKVNDSSDIVFGSVVSGRSPEIENVESLVGLFINTLPVRIKTGKDEKFSALLKRVNSELLENLSYSYVPLAEIQSVSSLKYELLNHILIFENFPIARIIDDLNKNNKEDSWTIKGVNAFEQTNYPFNVRIVPSDEFKIIFNYNQNIYGEGIIESIKNNLLNIIESVINNVDIKIKEINFLSSVEKNTLLNEFNNTELIYDQSKTINELFIENVRKYPNRIAISALGENINYDKLNRKSDILAKTIISKYEKQNQIIAIWIDHSVEMIVSILAVLKSGNAYLPIDSDYPVDRVMYMLEDTGAELMISKSRTLEGRDFNSKIEILNLDNVNFNVISNGEIKNLNLSKDLAYVIYTSGSTGKPKGVMIEHRSVHNFIKGIANEIEFNPFKNVLVLTSFSFDIFVLEALMSLLYGAKIILADKNQDPQIILHFIEKNNIDLVQVTPSMLKLLLERHNGGVFMKGVATLLIGGEELPESLFNEIKKYYKGEIYNMYGPTETTIWSTVKKLTNSGTVTIGKPIANTQIYILGKEKQLNPVNVSGELYIGGDGLARGYWKRTELTDEKFIENPFKTGAKMYHTGDIAKWLPNGDIEFLGRIDRQVKIRGVRIELQEIEKEILKHEDIYDAVVLLQQSKESKSTPDKQLIAYIVTKKDISVSEIRKLLSRSLHPNMIPSVFVKVDEIPLTSNGKIDKKTLENMGGRIGVETKYVAPRNDFEKQVVSIWKEVLGQEEIGLNDNLFDLGGNSLSIIQLSNKLGNLLTKEIHVNLFFEFPTINTLVKALTSNNQESEISSVDWNIENEESDAMMHESIRVLNID